jgi:prepilin peptidase CpaA
MYKVFFPNPIFAWAFCALLLCMLAVAAVIDQRRMVIPKWLTLSMLAAGAALSIARGAWLGSQEAELWMIGASNVWLGALDGFLFALLGCLASFALQFVMWILGACGGGDVKLFAALGAWIGPLYALYVLGASLAFVLVLFVVQVGRALLSGEGMKHLKPRAQTAAKKNKNAPAEPPRPPRNRIAYSLPVALATLAVLLWVFRVELQLAPPRVSPTPRVAAHAR